MAAWRLRIHDYGDPVQPPVSSPVPVDAVQPGQAWFGGLLARGLIEVTDDPSALDGGGWWAVLISFEGQCRFWRFAQVEAAELPGGAVSTAADSEPADGAGPEPSWTGPAAGAWRSSLDRVAYQAGVEEIRRRIQDGDVYQVNLCRVLSAELPADQPSNVWALARRLASGNPAPYAGVIDVPESAGFERTRVVCASPELFLERDAEVVRSGPIKGTGATEADLLPKDEAENVMIVDLVRNDLQRVSRPGTVDVPALLQVEHHPGLVHLVSTVQSRLRDGVGWAELLAATVPPGSVSGAPKSSALRAISDLEPVPRGPYCGAVGYVDADRGYARLAVGIRTFWWQDGELRFGTGAGITWGSDPEGEWAETELKAARLIDLASDHRSGHSPDQVRRRATAASRSR
jgi:para-aminobenzoate synthetase component I